MTFTTEKMLSAKHKRSSAKFSREPLQTSFRSPSWICHYFRSSPPRLYLLEMSSDESSDESSDSEGAYDSSDEEILESTSDDDSDSEAENRLPIINGAANRAR